MKVVVCVRNVAAGEQVRSRLPAWCQPNVRIQPCDLSDLASVQKAARRIQQAEGKVHLLINNAGIMALPTRHETSQGLELQFGTNHVGHYALTRWLLPLMGHGEGGRIVTVASEAHKMGSLDFTDLNYTRGQRKYSGWGAYGQSKLANILFAKGLNDRLGQEQGDNTDEEKKILSVSLHPGVIKTNLWQYTLPSFLNFVAGVFADKTVEQGAATSVFCGLVDSSAFPSGGGEYFKDCKVVEPNDEGQDVTGISSEKLWEETEKMIRQAGFELPSKLFG